MPSPRDFIIGPWRAVSVLGVTEILSWGALFYPPVLTVPLIAADHGWSQRVRHGRLFRRPVRRRPGARAMSAR